MRKFRRSVWRFMNQVQHTSRSSWRLQAPRYSTAHMLGTHGLAYMLYALLLLNFYFSSSSTLEGHRHIQQSKDRTTVMAQAGEIVRIHCFHNDVVDTSTYMQQYRVIGISFHVGIELTAGHYKAALSGAIRNSQQQTFYVADDDRPLLKLKQATAEMKQGGYIVGLQRLCDFIIRSQCSMSDCCCLDGWMSIQVHPAWCLGTGMPY